MTEAEAFERRAMVRRFHAAIRRDYLAVEERIKNETDRGQPKRYLSFGVYDDAEVDKHDRAQAALCATLNTQKAMLDRAWALVKDVFGKDVVEHALDEGNQRIGDLPYVKEEVGYGHGV